MIRPLIVSLSLLAVCAPAASAALPAPTVSVDPRYAIAGKGIARTDFASNFAADTPGGVAVDGTRIYAVGEADGNVAILANNATGGYDSGFSGDGKLVLPISADPSRDFATAIIVLPDRRLRIIAATDIDPATSSSNLDVAILGLMPDGTYDPSFTTTIFGVGTGDDEPTRAAYDPASGRIAIVGHTNGKNDSWVAVRNASDGSPAAFGSGGSVIFDASPTFQDQAVDVAWRPDGGVAVLVKLTRDASTSPVFWRSLLRGFDAAGTQDVDVDINVGQVPTTPGGLLAWGGKLWVTGSTKNNGDTDAYLVRMSPDGSGQESTMFDMHGQSTTTSDATSSQGIDLDVLEGVVPTLVVVGSATNLANAAEWSAAAFNGLDGPVAAFGKGDLTIPVDGGQGAATAVMAGRGYLGVAGSLLVTSPNAELSYGTTRLLVDADKECDLSLTIVRPLELSIRGANASPIRLAVENKGRRLCSGRIGVPAGYALRGAVDTGIVGPSETAIVDLEIAYTGKRRFDDIIPIRIDVPGDSDTASNARLIHVVFIYCDVSLRADHAPSIMPAEGGVRVAFSVRNRGTTACRDAYIKAVSGGSRTDSGDRYTVAPARSVTDDAVLQLKANAPVGKRARLLVGARSRDEAARDAESLTLRPMVVGVGDTTIRARSSRSVSGIAAGAGGPQKASLRRVTRVELAVKKLGGTRKKPACSWLRSKAARVSRGSCSSAVWLRASGTSSWRLSLSRSLPPGRYEIRSRAVIRAGYREARFSSRDHNLVSLRVR